ncbi:MAG: DUF2306 domain-containing protein [Betaproteobacteria bacterium]|nr:DUF2306 domain-containing protein [Betaproteobacteria bacterium]
MKIPLDVMLFYGALLVWVAILAVGWRKRSFRGFLLFGVALLLVLNVRYFIEGPAKSITFFVGIYDVLHNFGVTAGTAPEALAACPPDNRCTVWRDTYGQHPSWGVAFYQRFSEGNGVRDALLYGHVGFNSIAFVLMMWQLFRPGLGSRAKLHRILGRVTLSVLLVGVACSCILAAEHGSVAHYGGDLAKYGFWFMAACVVACAGLGYAAIRRRDVNAHRIWMFRFAGSMWGAFWLFRVMEFVLGPLLRDFDTVSILICIWFSAPLGILIAEFVRRRMPAASLEEAPGYPRATGLSRSV